MDELHALRAGRSTVAGRPVLRRLLLTAMPLAAAGLVVVVAVGPTGPSPTRDVTSGGAGTAVTLVQVRPGDPAAGSVVLEHLALVAARQPPLVPRADQFVYLRTTGGGLDLTDPSAPTYVSDEGRQVWVPQRADATGLIVEGGESARLNPDLGGGERTDSYAALAALPRDPAALLARVRAQEAAASGSTAPITDAAVFQALGTLLQDSLNPPGVSATVYRAAALLPGVSQVPDAVDAAGRRGVGLAVQDEERGVRYEWVVDADTSTFLGSREYLVRGTSWGAVGTLVSAHAVLDRAIVDGAGQEPRPDQLVR